MKLDTHTRHLPGPGVLQGQEERWDEWEEILERVRDGNEDHDGESSRRDVLLIFKVAVGGHKRLHARLAHEPEQRTVLQPCPAALLHRRDLVARDMTRERPRHTFIQDDPHRPRPVPAARRLRLRGAGPRQEHLLGELQDSDCLLAPDAREVVEELIQRVSVLQVLQEGLHGHARPDEHGVPPRISGSLWIRGSLRLMGSPSR